MPLTAKNESVLRTAVADGDTGSAIFIRLNGVNADNAGAVAGTGVTVTERGDGTFHQTIITLTNTPVPVVDTGGANGGQGSVKVYTYPVGFIQYLGGSFNLTTAKGSGGITATGALVGSVGSAAAAATDATLTGTEADQVPSSAGPLTAGAGTLKGQASLVATAFDGHTAALTANLNLAVPDAGIASNDTITVNGTITLTWVNLGTYP